MTESPGRDATVFILLATYDGERYLPALLESLRAQTCENWVLLARDDGSQDGTAHLLAEAAAVDGRVRVLDDGLGHLGVTGNFAALASAAHAAGARYFAFCDQDDVWLPTKLARLRGVLAARELVLGADCPLLAFSELHIVDESLRGLSASYFAHAHAEPCRNGAVDWMIVKNIVPGCAMMGNRALLAYALPMPEAVVIHDWWFGLCAACAGELLALREPLLLYRQHAGNVVGARSYFGKIRDFVAHLPARCESDADYFRLIVRQAEQALTRAEAQGGGRPGFVDLVRRFVAAMHAPGALQRVWRLWRLPVRRPGLARNLLLFCQVWRYRGAPPCVAQGEGPDGSADARS
ncbi:MAG: glycosyltransferase [Halothiobacillaceae bacterium]|nr:glycosyltransferase [Halothiobacillaceae bacterium]